MRNCPWKYHCMSHLLPLPPEDLRHQCSQTSLYLEAVLVSFSTSAGPEVHFPSYSQQTRAASPLLLPPHLYWQFKMENNYSHHLLARDYARSNPHPSSGSQIALLAAVPSVASGREQAGKQRTSVASVNEWVDLSRIIRP